MDKETAKAINTLSKKVNDIAEKLDSFINARCDDNRESIRADEEGIIEMSEMLSDHDEALLELAQMISDME